MRTRARWTVAASVTAVAGGALLVPSVASADPDLPPTTAAELLAAVATAEERSFSGTVVQTADLGLPQLPVGEGPAGELSTLLAGSTTLRLWSDGEDRSRVAVLGARAETDLVRDGDDVWVWRSDERTAFHAEVPEGHEDHRAAHEDLDAGATSPAEAARSALAALDPTTEVSVDGTATVAGRDAYELVLEPRSEESLVGSVRLAVDAETSYPLRVQVLARSSSEPAFETGFTSVSFTAPGAEVFEVTPPPGTEVEEVDLEELAARHGSGHEDGDRHGGGPALPEGAGERAGAASPTLVGEGWTSVLVLQGEPGALDGALGALEGASGGGAQGGGAGGLGGLSAGGFGGALLEGFTRVDGDAGPGWSISTALLSALVLDDGRVLVGAVAPEVLERAALDPAAS